MNAPELMDSTRTLLPADKGLLAMDENNPTCNKRFASLGISQTDDARRTWRELIVTTLDLDEGISGEILCAEPIRQQKQDSTPFSDFLEPGNESPLQSLQYRVSGRTIVVLIRDEDGG